MTYADVGSQALPDLELSFELYGRSLELRCRQVADAAATS